MKRLFVVIAGLLVMPAFAEVAPGYIYEDAVEYTDADDVVVDEAEAAVETPKVAPVQGTTTATSTRSANNRGMTTRGASVRGNSAVASRAVPAGGRTVAARSAVATGGVSTTNRVSTSRASRSTATARVANSKNDGGQNVTTRRAATVSSGGQARAGTLVTTGNSLYNSNVRVGVVSRSPMARSSGVGTAINVTNNTATTTTATDTTAMDELAQLSDYCKAQYQACMDNYCDVLDDNQGRCTCSKNLKNYEKTETALKEATAALQDVAQQIQYIGLSADEVETLFSQTEAEEAMSGKTDNSSIKASLDKIKKSIIDVKTGKASVSDSGDGMSLDLSGLLDFSLDSTGFDLGSLFGTSSKTDTITNQRGETLYKTATSRCKAAVLNNCIAQGVDASVITNAYDLEIDKQCIVYERQLSDSNEQMTATVRNAKTVLQKARLMVAQQKNQYDLRSCVNALDTCMQDDFVCGDDYEKCLDPTGKYIVDGAIVTGSTPGVVGSTSGLYATWDYTKDGAKDAWTKGNISEYIETQITATAQTSTSVDMAKFLAYKIGYNVDGKNNGMCVSVLNKCQDYTYDKNGKYIPNNNVVKEYLTRTLTTIKAQQDTVLANYAENCQSDIQSCLSTNGFDIEKEYTTTGNSKTLNTSIKNDKNKLATNACKSLITTCSSANGMTSSLTTTTQTVDSFVLSAMLGE